MGMLDKAKDETEKKGKSDGDSKKVEGDKKPKKKHKHPATSQAADEGSDAGADNEEAGGQEAPAADTDSESAPGQQGAGAAVQSPQGDADEQGGDADQQSAGGQPGGDAQAQGGAQGGPPPVKNAQAPGAGDDTSGGEDTPDEDEEQGEDEGAEGPESTASAGGGPGASSMQQVPMSPALKEEYQNLDRELVQKLYHGGIAEQLLPSLYPQGPHKIKSLVSLSVILAREIFVRQKAPLQLALPFARDVAAHVMQVGEQVKGIQYSDQECTAIFGAVYEGMTRAFGVKKHQFNSIRGIVPRSQFGHHARNYVQAHGHAQQAASANATQEHRDDTPTGGPAQAAGPQADGGAPQPQGGGMLAQAQGGGAPPAGGAEAPPGGEEE